jgi:Acyl-CoA carboxylase epsilon subunit
MIEIIKGNPTPEEIAALVAVLTLAKRRVEPRLTCSSAAEWRRATRLADFNSDTVSRSERRWCTSSAGWSRVAPAAAAVAHPDEWAASRNVS